MAGAANKTMGNMMVQATSHDFSQCTTNVPDDKNGKLAIAAAIKQVKPD
jgi:hypothetical protein